MLSQLVADGVMPARSGTAFAVTPTLREAYAHGDEDELGEIALQEAALASLRLLAGEGVGAEAGLPPRRAVLVAEAERDAQKLRGEGDAEAARIYGEAANRDPAFYAFQRSLEAYRKSFAGGDSVIVLERNDPFLQYLKSDR